ncbi:hypothetical protein B0H66DRAFT_48791 [Apodospora peruviana]|uniref:Zn(2)-C6 fungal-type domain-containing protein n=1 Tax=Apodospora peruviana TaxID=516989 RepID=A0AAE0MGJ3_9PEZI|nr:hypothetical protein B0H66DRAFT_48791 [Apodospora peruviana]
MSNFNPTPSPLPLPSTLSPVPVPQAPDPPFRRLLPASPGATPGEATARLRVSNTVSWASSNESPAATRPASPAPSNARKRRQATTAACGPCRKRKSKCDGHRPKCTTCRERNTDCSFDTNVTETHAQALKRKFNELQSQTSVYERLYDVLRGRSEQEANEVLQRIRRGADLESVLRQVNYGDVLLQLALVPEARYRYEFPCMSEMPTFLLRLDNPYLDSEVYACHLRAAPTSGRQQQLPSPANTTSPSPHFDEDILAPYSKPFHAVQLIEPWFNAVSPSHWTSVSTDDVLMRTLIHDYLLYECSWLAPFHKDYFLQDMANERHRFCSELLVNAVLAIATFYHRGLETRAEYWNPRNIGYQFLAEARRLFEIETAREKPRRCPNDPDWDHKVMDWELGRLAAIQSGPLMSLIYNYNGSDKIGWRYGVQACQMASEIQLFSPRKEFGCEMQNVRDYTAWQLYIFQGTHRYHCFRPPLIKEPPETPLPDPIAYPDWYGGELWVKYPLSRSRSPTHHGLTIKAKTELLTICIELASVAFEDSESHAGLPMDTIIGFYDRLVEWQANLPEPLTPRKIAMPHHMKLHMYYNSIMINLLQPIMMRDWSDGARSDRARPRKSPRDAYLDAKMFLETTIRLYYLRHGFEATDPFMLQFLISLTQLTIDTINADRHSPTVDESRATLLLTTKGLYDQGRSLYVVRAILCIQIGLMLPEDVERLRHFAKIEAGKEIYAPLVQPIHSDWVPYTVGHDENAEGLTSKIDNLALGRTSSQPR